MFGEDRALPGKKVNCPPSPFLRPDAADSRSFQDIICLKPALFTVLTAFFLFATAGDALAHASDRGFVLLLPTGHYIVGGAIAVAASFLALVLLPPGSLGRLASARLPLFRLPAAARPFVSLASFAALLVLVAAGLFGSRDPLSNPLPLTVWTLLWVGLTLAQGVLGNLWAWINPWYGPAWLARRLGLSTPMLRLPRPVGCWPAFILFAGFAWFELIDPAPDDPSRLAAIVLAYAAVNLAATLRLRLSRLDPPRRVPVGVLRHDRRDSRSCAPSASTGAAAGRSASDCPARDLRP